ncbi:hypothetical protein OAH12_02395 [Cyclobacteriaceae bacterium]|nr:hypothetical protein [Cyclobacteriaceae bacterium]
MKNQIYFDKKKVIIQILIGASIWVAIIFVPLFFILKIIAFFLGGSFLYLGSKGISMKPQMIFDEEGVYIALKINKRIKWTNILKAQIIQKSVDYRTVDTLQLNVRATIKGKQYNTVIESPIHLLEVPAQQILNRINQEIE